MTNGLEIKNEKDIKELYKTNPDEVVIFIATNLIDVKKDVYEVKKSIHKYQDEFDKKLNDRFSINRFKNFIIQFPGGVFGGVIACYVLLKAFKLI